MASSKRLLLPALLLAAPWTARGQAQPDPASLLKKAMAEPRVAYEGQMMVTRWFGKQTRAEEVNVFYAPSNRYRWEFLAPDGSVRRVVVSDGSREELRLLKERKTLQGDALKTYSKLISPDRELELLLKNYRLAVLRREKVAGRPAWVLELTPTAEGKARQDLWIDAETGVILENKRFHPERPFAALSRFTRFELAKSLPKALFETTPEAGPGVDAHGLDPDFLSLEDLDKALGRRSVFPGELVGGFVFESADFFDVGKHVVRHARYTDGLTVMSLFETDRPVRLGGAGAAEPSPAGWPPGSLHLSSSGKVLSWHQGKRYYTLVGDVSKELLSLIAGGVRKSAR